MVLDPPYSTGNDGFKYNDSFNHSTWLTFMKNRLELAQRLLSATGIILVSLSDKESKALLDATIQAVEIAIEESEEKGLAYVQSFIGSVPDL